MNYTDTDFIIGIKPKITIKKYKPEELFINMQGCDNYIDYHKSDKAIILFSGTWREMKLTNKQRCIERLRKNKSLKNIKHHN